jgi:hypothetical protein
MSEGLRHRRTIASIAVGFLLGFLSLFLPSFDALWQFFGVAQEQRVLLSIALALMFSNVGFLLAMYFQQTDFMAQQSDQSARQVASIVSMIPSTKLYLFQTGDEAMITLAKLLPTVKTVWNTRIFTGSTNPTNHPGFSAWDTALRDSVRLGLTFREVVSAGNEDLARLRQHSVVGGRGVYEASVLRYQLPSFLNFCVVESHAGTKEVWFGWVISRGSGFEGTVVRTAEARVVALFEHWHGELFGSGRPVR